MLLLASFVDGQKGISTVQKPHIKEILKQMQDYVRNPHQHIAIFPNESK